MHFTYTILKHHFTCLLFYIASSMNHHEEMQNRNMPVTASRARQESRLDICVSYRMYLTTLYYKHVYIGLTMNALTVCRELGHGKKASRTLKQKTYVMSSRAYAAFLQNHRCYKCQS